MQIIDRSKQTQFDTLYSKELTLVGVTMKTDGAVGKENIFSFLFWLETIPHPL